MEYAILVLALVVALLAAQTALRRAISSKWREAGDSFGTRQYEPGLTTITGS